MRPHCASRVPTCIFAAAKLEIAVLMSAFCYNELVVADNPWIASRYDDAWSTASEAMTILGMALNCGCFCTEIGLSLLAAVGSAYTHRSARLLLQTTSRAWERGHVFV